MSQDHTPIAKSSETIVAKDGPTNTSSASFDTLTSTFPPQPYTTTTSTSTPVPESEPTPTLIVDIDEMILKAKSGDITAQLALGDIYRDATHGVEQDYNLAMSWYLKAASLDNNPKAQLKIGHLYRDGFGVPQDDSLALEWFLKAAEQGDAKAQFNVGAYYIRKEDVERALEWVLKAAEQGLVEAEYVAGKLYSIEGCHKNFDKTMSWLLKAAEKSFAMAQDAIGDMYRFGQGVPKDSERAGEWYLKAAEQGDASAQCSLAILYKSGDGVLEDSIKAVEWYQKAAEQGDANAQCNLGILYMNGDGVPQDFIKGVELFVKSAEQGNTIGQLKLGMAYREGQGIERDLEEARRWCERAAREGKNAMGLALLGALYHLGGKEDETIEPDLAKARELYLLALETDPAIVSHLGDLLENVEQRIALRDDARIMRILNKDDSEAVRWFLKPAEQGNLNAQDEIGEMNKNGEGIEIEATVASVWYPKATEAVQGLANAQNGIGVIFKQGTSSSPQDYSMAVKWFREAAEQGNSRGELRIGVAYYYGEGVEHDYEQDYEQAIEWLKKASEQVWIDVANTKKSVASSALHRQSGD
ncbi:Sel1 repeat protein [Linnemannia elongata]|nr:Sel1 repeat protein [Linnemannia elongata]